MKDYTWFSTNDVDYAPGFKWWFALMWQNGYIQLAFINLLLLIGIVYSCEGYSRLFGLVPIGALAALVVLGAIKFPHELEEDYRKKHGNNTH